MSSIITHLMINIIINTYQLHATDERQSAPSTTAPHRVPPVQWATWRRIKKENSQMFSRVLKIHKSPPPLPPPPPGGPSGWLAAQVQALPARLHRTERSPAGALGNQRLILHSNRRLLRDKRPGNTWIFNTKTEVQVRGQGWKVSLSTELGPLGETFPRWSNQVVWLMLAAQIRFLIMESLTTCPKMHLSSHRLRWTKRVL